MDKAAEIERIAQEAEALLLHPAELCRRANINTSTWWRVRKNPEKLTLKVHDALNDAIKARRAERAAA